MPFRPPVRRTVATLVALLAVLVAWCALFVAAGSAQSLTASVPAAAASPSGVRVDGSFVTAPVTLDGAPLFRLATSVTQSARQPSALARAEAAKAEIAGITGGVDAMGRTSTPYKPASLKIEVRHEGAQDVLAATDAAHAAPESLLTVTPIDASYDGTDVDSLAAQWQSTLQEAIVASLVRSEPAVVRANVRRVAIAGVLLLAIVASGALAVVRLRRRIAAERATAAAQAAGSAPEASGDLASTEAESERSKRRFLSGRFPRSSDPHERANAMAALVIWLATGLVALVFGTVVWALSLFPDTTSLAQSIGRTAAIVVGTWLGAWIVNRLLGLLIGELAQVWQLQQRGTAQERERSALRIPTIVATLSGFKTVVVVFVVVLATLGQLGIPVTSVVTVGGIVAVGIGLAAQNFLRDFLAGFLVLFEDQYVVGDHVTMNGASGIVENLTLRMAQLRDANGSLVTIPHSSVTTVQNESRYWSRIAYHVVVGAAADPAVALAVVRSAIEAFASDPAYVDAVYEAVEWIGVDAFAHDWTVLRASVRVAPLKQYELRRDLNARVRAALLAANVELGPDVDAGRLASG